MLVTQKQGIARLSRWALDAIVRRPAALEFFLFEGRTEPHPPVQIYEDKLTVQSVQ